MVDDGEINFGTDSAALIGARTEQTLESLARFLRENPGIQIDIEGHTDSRGGANHNRKLSEARARALRDWLVEHGIDRGRLDAHGYGEDRPRKVEPPECKDQRTDQAPSWCEYGYWRHNRRTEFHVTSGLESLPDQCQEGAAAPDAGRCPDGDGTGEGIWPGFYVYLSPGFLGASFGREDLNRSTTYQWGLGLGYAWRPGARRRGFVGLGAGLEHGVFRYADAAGEGRLLGHDLRAAAELRLGGGSRRLVGYGLLAPGLGIGLSEGRTAPGFALGVGAGLWGLVWRGLFLGAETGLDPVIYGRASDEGPHRRVTTTVEVRALIGWHFGWRERSARR